MRQRQSRPVPGCPTCGGGEVYRVTRTVAGELVDILVCRWCGSGTPLVIALDRATDEVFAE